MNINVTQKHIDLGQVADCILCPVALALIEQTKPSFFRRLFRKKNKITVGYCTFCINSRRYRLPEEARVFIQRFDRCLGVTPFSFSFSKSDRIS